MSKLCVALIQFQLIDQLTDAAVGFVRHVTLGGGGISDALHDVLLVAPLMLQGFHLCSIHSRPPSLMVCRCTDTIANDKVEAMQQTTEAIANDKVDTMQQTTENIADGKVDALHHTTETFCSQQQTALNMVMSAWALPGSGWWLHMSMDCTQRHLYHSADSRAQMQRFFNVAATHCSSC